MNNDPVRAICELVMKADADLFGRGNSHRQSLDTVLYRIAPAMKKVIEDAVKVDRWNAEQEVWRQMSDDFICREHEKYLDEWTCCVCQSKGPIARLARLAALRDAIRVVHEARIRGPKTGSDWERARKLTVEHCVDKLNGLLEKTRMSEYDGKCPADAGSPGPTNAIYVAAKSHHENWLKDRRDQGWRWGPQHDGKKKLNPYLLEFDELGHEQRDQELRGIRAIFATLGLPDYATAAEIRSLVARTGWAPGLGGPVKLNDGPARYEQEKPVDAG